MSKPPLPKARRRLPIVTALVLVVGVLIGVVGWLTWQAPIGEPIVDRVVVGTKAGLTGNAAESLALIDLDTPDLYVVLHLIDGDEVRLPTADDTPIGGGLLWPLPEPLDLAQLERVAVWDNDLISDDLLDQWRPENQRRGEGGRFTYRLRGDDPQPVWYALPLLIAGGVLSAAAAGKLVYDQTV